MRFKKTLFALFCAPYLMQVASADDFLTHIFDTAQPEPFSPWFTGPLLAPSVHTIPQGHFDIEPYYFFWTFNGSYDERWNVQSSEPNFYSMQLLVPAWVGVTSFLDFTAQLQGTYQFTQGQRSVEFGDLPFGVDIQLLNEGVTNWWQPAIKLGLKVVAPTGRYKDLNPNKLGTDVSGAGNWQPTAVLSLGRLFQVSEKHFFSPRLAFSYTVPTAVHVSNYNAYGGTQGTKGKVFPGNILSVDFGFEYNITQSWAFACDAYYQHNNKNRFSGNTGFVDGVAAIMTSPSSDQFSVAPALEYNWNANIGLIWGVWFSVAGRNTARFVTGTIAFNWYL